MQKKRHRIRVALGSARVLLRVRSYWDLRCRTARRGPDDSGSVRLRYRLTFFGCGVIRRYGRSAL